MVRSSWALNALYTKEHISIIIWRWIQQCSSFEGVINAISLIFHKLSVKVQCKFLTLQKFFLIFMNIDCSLLNSRVGLQMNWGLAEAEIIQNTPSTVDQLCYNDRSFTNRKLVGLNNFSSKCRRFLADRVKVTNSGVGFLEVGSSKSALAISSTSSSESSK